MTALSDTFNDFFGSDNEVCVNCGGHKSAYREGWCDACRKAGEIGSAERQLAYLESTGDTTGANNVREWIAEKKAETTLAEQALRRVNSGTHTNVDLHLLVKVGIAYNTYDDPEINAPTGVVISEVGDGNPYADQVGIDG